MPLRPTNSDKAPFFILYVRGKALLALHQDAAAIAEFQQIVSHPALVAGEPSAPVARLDLGRAYALAGDAAKAKAAYKDFLTLWKDADPDIPIYKQAKAECARLQ
jgi:predicted Zn-dependent protease